MILITLIKPAVSENPDLPPNEIIALRVNGEIKIDGHLNETVWNENAGITYFRQKNPVEGALPSQSTVVYVAYDNENLYVAARLYDKQPDSIFALLGRRDEGLATDLFGFFIDTHLDRRSGYYFGLSAAGTYLDGILLNDDWDDSSWDGVWYGKTRIDENGWYAEMQIPFSQLRFSEKENMIWGINFRRDIKRNEEELYLTFTPKNESGFVSRFTQLSGLDNIKPSKNLQFLPYIRAKSEHIQDSKSNPFNDGSKQLYDFGLDFKAGLSSNVTLNGTINPDFGQAEVDPAVINLSDYEVFYSEKRPFFIEGASIFEFGYGGSSSNWGFNWSNPAFFYSRRIGSPPSGSVPDSVKFRERPESSKIITAAKVSAQFGDGWNIGGITALTNREYARVMYDNNDRDKIEIEPLTFYSIIRAQKEFDKGRQGLGFIATGTYRDFENQDLRDIENSKSYSFGLDGWIFPDKEKVWVISGWAGLSGVQGNKKRILDLQTSPNHRFQRPDFKYESVDSTRTVLNGFAGRVTINKQKGNWIFNSAIGVIDPGFELSDLGFVWGNNKLNSHLGGGYRWTEPTNYFRQLSILGALFRSQDFDGNTTWSGLWYLFSMQSLGYNWLEIGGAYNPQTTNIDRTRGGPLTINKPGHEVFFWSQSDTRKKVWAVFNGYTYLTEAGSEDYNLTLQINWKPADNITLSLEPNISWYYPDLQWVDSFEDPFATDTYGNRYVFAQMRQKTFSSTIRTNWTFSPELSLQVYIQPLISSGNYYNFKFLNTSNSYDFIEFGQNNSTLNHTAKSDNYTADADGTGPAAPISWDNPDFTITSLRGNAVLKWEYLPGSALYLVWTQSRFANEDTGNIQFHRPYPDRFLNLEPDNIFLVKLTYWLGL